MRKIWSLSMMVLAFFLYFINTSKSQSLSVICPVFQENFASGSCNDSLKTENSVLKIYSSQGERAWAKFNISAIPDSVSIVGVDLHYYIDQQSYPYYAITSLPTDPVSASAASIWNHIGQASTGNPVNSNTYFLYTGAQVNGWNSKSLNIHARTDLQGKLPEDWFAVGFWEYEQYGNYFLQCHGWNQVYKPYLEVFYVPDSNNPDIGAAGLTPAGFLCSDTVPVNTVVYNPGSITINNVQINLSINNQLITTFNQAFPGGLAPGTYDTISLGELYFDAGYYPLSITLSNPNGLTDPNPNNNSYYTYIYAQGPPQIIQQPINQTVIVGTNVQFMVSATNAYIYQWQVSTDGGITFIPLTPVPPYSYVDSSQLFIQFAGSTLNGNLYRCMVGSSCDTLFSAPASLIIQPDSLSILNCNAYPDSVCASHGTQLHVVPAGGSGTYSFSWTSNPPGFSSSQQNPFVYPSQSTQYTCHVNDGMNTVIGNCNVITFSSPPAPGPIAGPTSVCKGQTQVIFSVNPIPNVNFYYWTFPSGITGSGYSNQVTVLIGQNAVSGQVTVKAHNACGYGPTSSLQFSVYPNPVVDAGPDQTIFAGNSVNITAVVSSGTPPYVFTWSNGQNGNNITVSPIVSTTYTVTVTDAHGCSSTDQVAVTVNTYPGINTYFSSQSYCPGTIAVPVMVENFFNVASISLSIIYDTAKMAFSGYSAVNNQLSTGVLLVNGFSNQVQIAWFSLTPANIGYGSLLSLLFQADTGAPWMGWDTITQGACNYTDLNNIQLQSWFYPGILTVQQCNNYSGYVKYNNSLQSPLKDCPVTLQQNDTIMYQTVTDSTGFFQFTSLASGIYHTRLSPVQSWGGVNAADALMILKHFTGMTSLNGLVLEAGDVDLSGAANSIDALIIAKRFVHMIDSFPAGDWVVSDHFIHITGNTNISDTLLGLCTGDVDQTYLPQIARIRPDIRLEHMGYVTFQSGEAPGISLVAGQDLVTGSVSAVIEFSSDCFRFAGMGTARQGNLLYTFENNILRFAWYSLEPMVLKEGDEIFSILVEAENSTGNLSLIPGIEFTLTDDNGIPQSVLIGYRLPGTALGEVSLGQNHPNPFTQSTEIPFYLDEISQVRLYITDLNGHLIKTLLDQEMSSGAVTYTLPGEYLAPGMYFLILNVFSENVCYHNCRKLIKQ